MLTLLLIGEHEVIYQHKPQRVLERGRRLILHIEADPLPIGYTFFR